MKSLTTELADLALRPVLDDDLWKVFGFKNHPLLNNFRKRQQTSKILLEKYLARELVILGLVDVLHGISESKLKKSFKARLATDTIDELFYKIKGTYDQEVITFYAISTLESFKQPSDGQKILDIIYQRARKSLNKDSLATFKKGFDDLIKDKGSKTYLIKPKLIVSLVEVYGFKAEFDPKIESKNRNSLALKLRGLVY